MAQPPPIQVKLEKPRIHNLLGDSDDLARHLILWVLAVPA
jgi:hypothetical protein